MAAQSASTLARNAAALQDTSIKSQIADMSGVNPQAAKLAAAPIGQAGRFVHGDIKGGDAMHAFRLTVIGTAVLEAYKGNSRNLAEAGEQATGKAKKARAYAAGFLAIGDITMLERVGKWLDSANAAVRTQADTLTAAATLRFDSAYRTVMAEKAAPKAAKAAKAAPVVDAPAPAVQASTVPADITVETEEHTDIDVGTLVDTVASALSTGMLEADEVAALRAALAAYDTAQAAPVNSAIEQANAQFDAGLITEEDRDNFVFLAQHAAHTEAAAAH